MEQRGPRNLTSRKEQMMTRKLVFSTVLIGGLAAIFSLAQAQDPNQPPPGGPGQGGREEGRRRWDPAQFRDRMMSGIKDQTGATEDEWRAMQPKVEKIMGLQRDLRPMMSGFGGFGGFGRSRDGGEGQQGGQPPQGFQPQGRVSEAQRGLRSALDDKNTPADELTRRLAAYREARDRAREELKETQKDLKAGINPRGRVRPRAQRPPRLKQLAGVN